MPSYDDALTVFSEARSLLARAEDAMQHAVQAEQQKSAELRRAQMLKELVVKWKRENNWVLLSWLH